MLFRSGQYIISSVNSISSFGGVADPRNPVYGLSKISGTSMAPPQVTGILACALGNHPNMTPAQALEYIVSWSKKNQIVDTPGGYGAYWYLRDSPNRYAYYREERPPTGDVFPKKSYFVRPNKGIVYPRTKMQH